MKTEITHNGTEAVIRAEANGQTKEIKTGTEIPKEDFENWRKGQDSISAPILDAMKTNAEEIAEELEAEGDDPKAFEKRFLAYREGSRSSFCP